MVSGRIGRVPRTCHQMQAERLVRALRSKATSSADVARRLQPNPRQHDAVAFSDPFHDGAQDILNGADLRHRDHHLWQVGPLHGYRAILRLFVPNGYVFS